jgi:zinc protease
MARGIAVALLITALLATAPHAQSSRVLQPGTSPLVVFRVVFMTGAALDPPGKEGLASLTASLLAEGGSRSMTYRQIVDAMYPLATALNWQVDKE